MSDLIAETQAYKLLYLGEFNEQHLYQVDDGMVQTPIKYTTGIWDDVPWRVFSQRNPSASFWVLNRVSKHQRKLRANKRRSSDND